METLNRLAINFVEEISQISDTKFAEPLDELKHCIRQPNPAPAGDFCLDLSGNCFDREEANAR